MPSLVTHEREKEKQMEKSNFFMWKGSGTAGAERWRSVTGGPFLALIRCADGQIFLGLVYRAGLGSLGRWSAGRVEVLMELMADTPSQVAGPPTPSRNGLFAGQAAAVLIMPFCPSCLCAREASSGAE
ncbi:hypothetical protein GOP47_0011612 [Adiantum capillus-veneris]|uniref:Uncharacterized protein n=1 Tax=Adiantum capillus-veneris TaxID=13818 RepID=A0A9D4ZFK0_ADICA|nr:hypothetical protein GOP47_0011612 [Adiantum capillus-veneris]